MNDNILNNFLFKVVEEEEEEDQSSVEQQQASDDESVADQRSSNVSEDQKGDDQPQAASDDDEHDQQDQNAGNRSSEEDSPSSGEEILSSSDEYKPKSSSDSPDSDLEANISENDDQVSEIGDNSTGDKNNMDQEVDSSQKQEQQEVEMSDSIDVIPDSQPESLLKTGYEPVSPMSSDLENETTNTPPSKVSEMKDKEADTPTKKITEHSVRKSVKTTPKKAKVGSKKRPKPKLIVKIATPDKTKKVIKQIESSSSIESKKADKIKQSPVKPRDGHPQKNKTTVHVPDEETDEKTVKSKEKPVKPRYFRPPSTLEKIGEKPCDTDPDLNQELGKVVPDDDENTIRQFEEEKQKKFAQKMLVIKKEKQTPKATDWPDDFGDKSLPKNKSSSKIPAKSSKKRPITPSVTKPTVVDLTTTVKRPISPRAPTPPPPDKVTKSKSAGKDSSTKKKLSKPHTSSKDALKTLSELREVEKDITSEPPVKRLKVNKYADDYDDAGGAGTSGGPTVVPSKTNNPLSVKNTLLKSKVARSHGGSKNKPTSVEQPLDKVQIEREKLDALKELTAKYVSTTQAPIIIAPPMMSPTPSVGSIGRRVVDDEEDELDMWGRLVVKKLRKFKDKKTQEDVQNYIQLLLTDAGRGEWNKPRYLSVSPDIVPRIQNVTPDRPNQVTHIIRSPGLIERPNRNQDNVDRPNQSVEVPGRSRADTAGGHVAMEGVAIDQLNTTSTVVGDNLRLLNQNPAEFSYTWQSSSATNMPHAQHNPQIYVNCHGMSRERAQDPEGEVGCSGQRRFTNL